jgi:catechol 2,3-dioxygenase-like lactoylglutathione lyase family enzyme
VTELNHTIVWCHDKVGSAQFLAELLGRPAPTSFGPFQVVSMDNAVSLDFYEVTGEIARQHYAFLISEGEFDAVLARIRARDITYWADPGRTQQNQFNTHDGGRGLYWLDPNGHVLEVITRPYGSGG